MSCSRIAREVIEFFRFGELDARCVPHLDHLAVCTECREEVGLDRALVIQLQRAIRARVDGHAASPGAWLEIRRRALQPEPPDWRGRLLPVLRLAPVAATVIVVLAVLVPDHLSPFRTPPVVTPPAATWSNFDEAAVDDAADPYAGRWWLRYTTPAQPPDPLTGSLPTADPWEPATVSYPRLGGAVR